MKKMISILLLCLYLVSTSELYQLLKIPILIEHYIDHKEQNPGMTVNSFFRMHYEHPVKDSDYQTDQKLPFVSHAQHLLVVFTVTPLLSISFAGKPVHIIQSEETLYKSIFYNKEILNSIWQPPKFC